MVEMEVLTARIGAREAENEKEKAICCLTCVFIIVSLPLTKVGSGAQERQPTWERKMGASL